MAIGNDGIIVSETEPEANTKVVWIKPLPSGGEEWYQWDGGWSLTKTVPAPALANHTYTELANLNITGTLSASGASGLTGTRTVGGFKFTFTKGLLTGFEVA